MRIWRIERLRAWIALICAALLCALPVRNALAESTRTLSLERIDDWVIVRTGAVVYRDPSLAEPWTRVSGMVVRRPYEWSPTCTAISKNGRMGYVKSSDVRALAPGIELCAARDTRAYARPSLDSRRVRVRAGTVVELVGIDGSCAEVRRDGVVAYMYIGHLKPVGVAEAV